MWLEKVFVTTEDRGNQKDFYHEDHEDHEESTGFKNVFVLFVSFVVSISLHLELLHANTARHEDCRVGGASSQ